MYKDTYTELGHYDEVYMFVMHMPGLCITVTVHQRKSKINHRWFQKMFHLIIRVVIYSFS